MLARSRAPSSLPLTLLLAGLAVALLANAGLATAGRGWATALAFGAAAALFVAGALAAEPPTGSVPVPQASPDEPDAAPISWLRLTGALLLGLAVFLTMGDWHAPVLDPLTVLSLCTGTRLPDGWHQFTWLNTTCWLAAMALTLHACWDTRPRPRIQGDGLLVRRLRRPWTALALAAILLLGAGLLFFRIAGVPREMTSDHAEKLLDVLTILGGQRPIYFPCNTGREAAQFYLIALMTPLAGISYLTMKLGTALLAWLALPFAFLFARALLGTGTALLATLLMATSRWLLQVGRVGLRFPFAPLCGAAIFYLLCRALRDRRRNDFLLCGLALGLAQHTYTTLRFAPLAVVACATLAGLADLRRRRWRRAGRLLADLALLALVALVAFIPLARYGFDQPATFLFRGLSRVVSDDRSGPPAQAWWVFLDNVKNGYLMFNWQGDLVWVNNIAGQRILDPVGGALFVLGCAYGLYRILRYRDLAQAGLQLLLFAALLPSILSLAYPLENPSTVRSGMALPVVALLMAQPLRLLVHEVRRWLRPLGARPAAAGAAVLCAALLVPGAASNAYDYFAVYPVQHDAASQHTAEAAAAVEQFVASGGRKEDVHVLPWTYWFDPRLLAILLGDIRWQPSQLDVQAALIDDGSPHARLYLLHPQDFSSLEQLMRWYPAAIVQTHFSAEEGIPWFVTLRIPPQATAVESPYT